MPSAAANGLEPASGSAARQPRIHFDGLHAKLCPDTRYVNGESMGRYTILESLGGGIGVMDFDRDGRWDLFLPGGGWMDSSSKPSPAATALWRNVLAGPVAEAPDGMLNDSVGGGISVVSTTQRANRATGEPDAIWFRSVETAARVDNARHYSHGAAVHDFDQDGFDDVLMTGYGGVQLWWNQGDGTFQDITDMSGLADPLWSSTAAWGDFNGDQYPDLFIAHYVDWSPANDPPCQSRDGMQREVCSPRQFQGLPNRVFLNQGNGQFIDHSTLAGLRHDGKSLSALVADLDRNRTLDVYVTNDTEPNFFYEGNQRGGFHEQGLIAGAALGEKGTADGSMGVDLGDYNRDGRPDLWVTNFERETFALYRSEGAGLYFHASETTGVAALGALYVGWGTAFGDLDNDGDEDLLISNGHVIRHPTNAPVLQPAILLENDNGQRFRHVVDQAGGVLERPRAGRGLVLVDLDQDGRLDAVLSPIQSPVEVLRNTSPMTEHALRVQLVGTASPRTPIGTHVTAEVGGLLIYRQLKSGGSYASTMPTELHLGTGTADRIDRLTIEWPAGGTQVLENIAVNQLLIIREPGDAR